eukprot:1058018-Pelagomonas_calceolata.AAC.2
MGCWWDESKGKHAVAATRTLWRMHLGTRAIQACTSWWVEPKGLQTVASLYTRAVASAPDFFWQIEIRHAPRFGMRARARTQWQAHAC